MNNQPRRIADSGTEVNNNSPDELLREAERELISIRQKLESANRSRSDLLGKMSHEFRTPMTAIVGMTDLLLLGELSAEHRDCLGTVRDAADDLIGLLNDVCDYARIEAGTLEFEWIGFRLSALIEETVRKLAPSAHAKRVELVVRVAPDVPAVLVADPHRIGQIVHNLVHNAIRMTKAGEVVLDVARVSEAADEVLLKFTVRDTGVGIAAEDQHRLFLPFMATDSSLCRRYPLSPMGLPLTAALASALGGRLTLRSEVGRGACFEADLRVLKQHASSTLTANQPNRDPLYGLTGLVISPNASLRRVIGEMLGACGMQAILTSNIEGAVAELDVAAQTNNAIAVILIDAVLSREADPRIHPTIRNTPARAGSVILLAPAVGETFDARQCESLGIAAILHKPVFERELVETLLTTVRGVQTEHSLTAATYKSRVLVVEAAGVNRALTVRLLTKKGYTVTVAECTAEARSRLAIDCYDLVLLDCDLANAAEVAALAAQLGISVVELAAAIPAYDLRPGAQVLTRPVNAGQLYRTITEACCGQIMNHREDAGEFHCEIDAAIARLGGDIELYKELVQSFLDDTSGLLPKIQLAIEARDADALHRAGHSLKGLAASCGATGVAAAATRLEHLGREHRLEELEIPWQALSRAFSATRHALGPYYSNRSS